MKIWIIDHYSVPEKYYPLIRNTNFAKELTKLDHDVRIIGASSVHNSDINLITDDSLFKKDIEDGVKYTYIKCCSYKGNGIKRILNMQEFAHKLPKVCDILAEEEGKPDVILACSMTLQACMAGIKIAKKYHAKALASVTDLWPETIVAYGWASKKNPAVLYLRHMEKWIYMNADKVIFSMEGAYDYIVEQGWEEDVPRGKVEFINNGVDLEKFDYNREHFKVEDEDLANSLIKKIVYTGSVRHVNNVGRLLDIAQSVTDKDVKFLIWGDGDELESLKKRAIKENITNVSFKGRVEKKYIPYIVSRADINVLHNTSSALYRFGISMNKLFDYMAAGKPIYCTFPCKYNPVILSDAGAYEDFNKFINKDKNEYASNARRAAEEVYNFKKLTEKLLKCMQEE